MTPQLLSPGLLLSAFLVGAAAAQVQKPAPDASDALFDPSRVIQIEIRLDSKDWLALRISHPVLDEDGNISVTEKGYEYYRGDVLIDGQAIKSVGVRKKGAWGSTSSSRAALKIKFDEYVKDQEFVRLDMLTLNNCVGDPTKAQQILASSFMARAGVPAPRSNLARVVVNGEDLGIYSHVESIRKAFISRFFPNANGDLYENVTNADLTTNLMNRLAHKWGKDIDRAQLKKLVDVLETPGPVSLAHVESHVDVNAFIQFWAAEVMIGHWDSYPTMFNNFYIYGDTASGRFHFIPGTEDSVFTDRQYGQPTPKSVKAMGYLCQRLWELPEIQERYREEMRRLLDVAWDEKGMLSELQRIRRLCEGDADFRPKQVKEFLDRIASFVEGRRKALQPELEGPAPVWPIMPERWTRQRSADTNTLMHVEGSFSGEIVDTISTNLLASLGQGSATLQFSIDGKRHKPFTRFGVQASASMIRIVAVDAVGDLRWTMNLGFDPYRVAAGHRTMEFRPFGASVRLIQGEPNTPSAQVRWSNYRAGTLELTQVSTNLGGTISGKFKINTTAFEEDR